MEAEARPGREGEPHGDDSLMGRFDRWRLRRFSGWDAVKAVALTTFLLLIFAGGSVRKAADELKPGLGRDIVKAVGGPTKVKLLGENDKITELPQFNRFSHL